MKRLLPLGATTAGAADDEDEEEEEEDENVDVDVDADVDVEVTGSAGAVIIGGIWAAASFCEWSAGEDADEAGADAAEGPGPPEMGWASGGTVVMIGEEPKE